MECATFTLLSDVTALYMLHEYAFVYYNTVPVSCAQNMFTSCTVVIDRDSSSWFFFPSPFCFCVALRDETSHTLKTTDWGKAKTDTEHAVKFANITSRVSVTWMAQRLQHNTDLSSSKSNPNCTGNKRKLTPCIDVQHRSFTGSMALVLGFTLASLSVQPLSSSVDVLG